MKLYELLAGQSAQIEGADVEISSLTYDSRQVTPGGLFVAWRGTHSDGHDHIQAALDRGAVAVVTQQRVVCPGVTSAVVSDSRAALALIAKKWFGDPAGKMRLVGVTGTNGKTTTIHLLEAIFAKAGERPGIIGTLGCRYGGQQVETGLTTPQSLDLIRLLADMHSKNTTAVAMEVSSHSLEQQRVLGVDFDVGVFTNLSHDHLDYHHSMEAYFAAKKKLFTERLKTDGRAVVNLDDTWGQLLASQIKPKQLIGFSLTQNRAKDLAVSVEKLSLGPSGIEAELKVTGHPVFSIKSGLLGRFNAANILGAIAAAWALELPVASIQQGLQSLSAVPGRLERVSGEGAPLVVVDYAHTPDALEKVLTTVREIAKGRLVCVFGCGGDRDTQKRPLMAETAAKLCDSVVVTSDNPRSENPDVIIQSIENGFLKAQMPKSSKPTIHSYAVEPDRDAAISLAIGSVGPNDAVVLAGKGHEDYQLVAGEKRPFDDRLRARAALKAAGYLPLEG